MSWRSSRLLAGCLLLAFFPAVGEVRFIARPEGWDPAATLTLRPAGGSEKLTFYWPASKGAVPIYSGGPFSYPLLLEGSGNAVLLAVPPEEVVHPDPGVLFEGWFRAATVPLSRPRGPLPAESAFLLALACLAGLAVVSLPARSGMLLSAAGIALLLVLPPPAEELGIEAGGTAALLSMRTHPVELAWIETAAGRLYFLPMKALPETSSVEQLEAPEWIRAAAGLPDRQKKISCQRGLWRRLYFAEATPRAAVP